MTASRMSRVLAETVLITALAGVLVAPPAVAAACSVGYQSISAGSDTICQLQITTSGTWTPPTGITAIDVVVVGGGGGGGGGIFVAGKPAMAGNGGGGGLVTVKTAVAVSGPVNVTVGGGGTEGSELASGSPVEAGAGAAGAASSFGSITAAGGSGGQAVTLVPNPEGARYGGGSGASIDGTTSTTNGGSNGNFLYSCGASLCGSGVGGGGAGAGADGMNGYYSGQAGAGNGGAGLKPVAGLFAGNTSSYGGGGGGGNSGIGQWGSSGGAGGGGAGGVVYSTSDGIAGGANTGGGGGGAGGPTASSGPGKPAAGGSGIVIVRYLLPTNVAPVWTTSTTLPSATAGTGYSKGLEASGTPTPSYALAATSALPSGLNLGSDGSVTGTPSTPGAYNFTVTASNVAGSVDRTFTLEVRPPAPPAPFAAAGDTTATLSWVAIPGATEYTITDGEGHTCTANAPTTTCTVDQLTNGTPYNFTLSVTINAIASQRSPSSPVTPIAASSLGDGKAQENGVDTSITVTPDTPTGGSSVIVAGSGWSMTLAGLDASGNPIPLDGGATLTLDQSRNAAVAGTGFMPNSLVYLYLYSSPTFLGTVATNGSGAFNGTVPVPSDVALGKHVIQANGFSPFGYTRSVSLPAVLAAETTLAYSGDLLLVTNNTSADATLSAQTVSAIAGCSVRFVLDNGQGGTQPGPFTALTGTDGIATVSPRPSIPIGVYSVKTSTSAPCIASPDETGSLIIASPGDAAYGGGWYQYPGSGAKANFGFVVQAQPKTSSYRGELVWSMKYRWRFKGKFNAYSVVSSSGAITAFAAGTGTLFAWDARGNNGLGGWTTVASAATVRVSFQPTATGKKSNSPGAFGIQFGNLPGNVSGLPATDRQALKGGAIKAS